MGLETRIRPRELLDAWATELEEWKESFPRKAPTKIIHGKVFRGNLSWRLFVGTFRGELKDSELGLDGGVIMRQTAWSCFLSSTTLLYPIYIYIYIMYTNIYIYI